MLAAAPLGNVREEEYDMPTVRYTVIGGEVIAEKRAGVRRAYVPNPLGSAAALLDNAQTKTDTFEFWPYGQARTRIGTTPTPFQFIGVLGNYSDPAPRTYGRGRTYDTAIGRWSTEDPLRMLAD